MMPISSLQVALEQTEEFCELTGMQLNETKKLVFGTQTDYASTIKAKNNFKYRQTSGLKGLGAFAPVQLTAAGYYNHRFKQARKVLERLRATQLSFCNKARQVAESVLPAALTGVNYSLPSPTEIRHLKIACARSIWGHSFPTMCS